MKFLKKKQGFTLIELLVVVSIIGVLVTVILVSLNKAKNRAEDSKRITESRQLQIAFESYLLDNNSLPVGDVTNCQLLQDIGSYNSTDFELYLSNFDGYIPSEKIQSSVPTGKPCILVRVNAPSTSTTYYCNGVPYEKYSINTYYHNNQPDSTHIPSINMYIKCISEI